MTVVISEAKLGQTPGSRALLLTSSPGNKTFNFLCEQGILEAVALVVACCWGALRYFSLHNQPEKVRSSWHLWTKMGLFASYEVIQIAILALWIDTGLSAAQFRVAGRVVIIAGYGVLWLISYLEHTRSIRPSTVLCVYTTVSILLELACINNRNKVPGVHLIEGLDISVFAIKVAILGVELKEKRRLLLHPWQSESPEATSGVFNRSIFFWLNGLLYKGYRGLLTIGSLPPLDTEIISASSPPDLIDQWEKGSQSGHNALFWIFAKHYKWAFLAGVLPRLLLSCFSLLQPFLIKGVLDYVDQRQGRGDSITIFRLIGGYIVVYFGLAITYAIYEQKTARLLVMFRGSLITLIYRKTLRVDSSSKEDGDIITMISADIDRIESMTIFHEMYASIIEAGIALWLIYRLLGLSVVAPVIWVIACFAAGIPLAIAAGNAQVPWLEAIEDRLAVTAKFLSMAKPIKMTGMTGAMASRIRELRKSEVVASRRHRIFKIYTYMWHFAASGLVSFWGFGMYILLAKQQGTETLTGGMAFAALSLFELLERPLTSVVDGFELIQTVLNSFRRIQEYLVSREQLEYRRTEQSQLSTASSTETVPSYGSNRDTGDVGRDAHVNGPYISDAKYAVVIDNVSVDLTGEGSLVLHELSLKLVRGRITAVCGPVGSGKSTLLKLLLGEVPLSSGIISVQPGKIGYCPQTPWITWGTIQSNIIGTSKLDRSWYDEVIEACSLGRDFKELPAGDQSAAGTEGTQLSGGQQKRVSLARALYSRSPIILLDDILSGLDHTTEQSIIHSVFGAQGILARSDSTVVLATGFARHLNLASHIVMLGEKGKVAYQGPLDGSPFFQEQPAVSTSVGPGVKDHQKTSKLPELEELEIVETDEEPDASRKHGDTRIFVYYARIAGWWVICAYMVACSTIVFGVTFPSVWLQWWTDANEDRPNGDIGYWLGIYGALVIITVMGCGSSDSILNLVVLPRAANRFHELLLSTTSRASAYFLTSTDAGSIMNRFSQDLELIDSDLPMSLDSLVFQFLLAITSIVLVCLGSLYILAAIPVCLVVLYVIQSYYLRTSRQMRLLDIEAKAPLFSQMLETLNGICSIRAYGWTQDYLERYIAVLNESQKPYYLMGCIQRWLNLVLDVLNAILAVLLVTVSTTVQNGSTGILGVALFHVLTLSSAFQALITEWTQVEVSLAAIKRVRTYVATVKDENLLGENGEVPENWPTDGRIIFTGVSAAYNASTGDVLNKISLDIQPGQRVAICGRTGSGKSSLISTLLRMLELSSGEIKIDGIDISQVPREKVRAQLQTVPQDPFLPFENVRENLDPSDELTDEIVIEALRSVQLWDLLESRGGLDGEIAEDTLSYGEQQLFGLARALLKPGKVVVLDEAMSAVDPNMEAVMHTVLLEKLRGRTVVAITHKLDSVMDYDCIVLLDRGRVVETGRPDELMARPDSAFNVLRRSLHQPGVAE